MTCFKISSPPSKTVNMLPQRRLKTYAKVLGSQKERWALENKVRGPPGRWCWGHTSQGASPDPSWDPRLAHRLRLPHTCRYQPRPLSLPREDAVRKVFVFISSNTRGHPQINIKTTEDSRNPSLSAVKAWKLHFIQLRR